MLNKQQCDLSKIESKEVIDDELLEQIALALEVPVDFLKKFDLAEHANNYYNNQTNTNTISDTAHDNEVNNTNNKAIDQEIINNYPIEQFENFARETLENQKKLLEEKNAIDKENALLKQELEFLKKKK